MKKQLLTSVIALSVVSVGVAFPSQAATIGSCSANIGPLVGSGGVGQSGFVGASSCTNSDIDNDTTADVTSIFGAGWTRAFKTNSPNTTSDEIFTQGSLDLAYDSGSLSGDWSLSNLASDVTSFILAIKAGSNEPNALLYYKFDDLSVVNGDWSTFGLLNNGGRQPSVSHMSVYTATDPAIPTPAMLPGLIGMGVAALRKRKLVAATEQEA